MQQLENIEAISESFCTVLEDLAFLFSDPVAVDELTFDDQSFVQASMQYTGSDQGQVSLVLPKRLMPMIAANILGLDEDDDLVHDKASDAVGEMLNIVCGQLLTTVFGDEPVFDLSPPVVQPVTSQQIKQLIVEGKSVAFSTDDEPVLLCFERKLGE